MDKGKIANIHYGLQTLLIQDTVLHKVRCPRTPVQHHWKQWALALPAESLYPNPCNQIQRNIQIPGFFQRHNVVAASWSRCSCDMGSSHALIAPNTALIPLAEVGLFYSEWEWIPGPCFATISVCVWYKWQCPCYQDVHGEGNWHLLILWKLCSWLEKGLLTPSPDFPPETSFRLGKALGSDFYHKQSRWGKKLQEIKAKPWSCICLGRLWNTALLLDIFQWFC